MAKEFEELIAPVLRDKLIAEGQPAISLLFFCFLKLHKVSFHLAKRAHGLLVPHYEYQVGLLRYY